MCAKVYKITGAGLRIFAALIVSLPLLFSGCKEGETEFTDQGNDKELANPGPDVSFWISLTVDGGIASDFKPVRVIVQTNEKENDKTGQLGQVAVSPAPAAQRYKITLPENYIGNELCFVVELQKIKSAFEKISSIKNMPMLIGFLKSRYYKVNRRVSRNSTKDIEIEVPADAKLTLGFGPNGIKIGDIPNAPLIYLLDIIDKLPQGHKFEFRGAVAVAPGRETPTFIELVEDLDNEEGGLYGFSLAHDMDWAMVMLPTYKEGDPFDILIFAKQKQGDNYCPCGGSCGNGSCAHKIDITSLFPVPPPRFDKITGGICPYKFAADYDYYHTIRKSITKGHLETEGAKETGSTIQMTVYGTDLESCEQFKKAIEKELAKLITP
jgi:hypothetical protein